MADPLHRSTWMQNEVVTLAASYGLPDQVRGKIIDLVQSAFREGARSATSSHTQSGVFYREGDVRDKEASELLRSSNRLDQHPEVDEERLKLGRYVDLKLLGRGGMGEVHLVLDPVLNRTMALKILTRGCGHSEESTARFMEEAQVTAQLQHPGIPPVHDVGTLPDGRLYYTMKEVRGATLRDRIREVHAASTARDAWAPAPSGWTFRKLMVSFLQVCEAVGFAHCRGVVHRDLKPENIMVGEFGECLVMDWGLAKVLGQPDRSGVSRQDVKTERTNQSALATRVGRVMGTPQYMAPEQALGCVGQIGPWSDVYALGCVLYAILCGQAPNTDGELEEVLRRVSIGHIEPFPSDPRVPGALRTICERALSMSLDRRYPDASALSAEVASWLDGARRLDEAAKLVETADGLLPEVVQLRQRAEEARREAGDLLKHVRSYESVEKKITGWQCEDHADELEADAELKELEYMHMLRSALNYSPDYAPAHRRLASHYRARHQEAEENRERRSISRASYLLRQHDHRREYATYLEGKGELNLVTDPPGARVLLVRYVPHERRLVPSKTVVDLGHTPLERVPLERGSYLAIIRAPGHAEVRYPIQIERLTDWNGTPPGACQPLPVVLAKHGDLGSDDLLVPGGWYWAGGDTEALGAIARRRLWVDSFVMRRFPVTNQDYIRFLDSLVDQGREDDALAHVPRLTSDRGEMRYGRDESGRFKLVADEEGDLWHPQWPVLCVSWFNAMSYAQWVAQQTGLPWRLASEWEWEKAGRGVDGRFYPWGDHFDASWCCVQLSHAGQPLPQPIDSFPIDESPYGVRGLAGNAQDWCLEAWRADGPQTDRVAVNVPTDFLSSSAVRVQRGGIWDATSRFARLAFRDRGVPSIRSAFRSIRLVRSWPLSR